jgi:tyrosyl-tRNA synthetase
MPTPHNSLFLRTLAERGFIHQITDVEALDARLVQSVVTGYCGFDCTAQSLHIGNLVSIMMLYWLQQCGHRPIVLIGGGTTKVGDPSGKDDTRRMLNNDDIAANIASIRPVFDRLLRFGDGETGAVLVNNADWLDTLAYIPFLREIGRHFSVNRMLSMDSVKLRLEREQPLSFIEFNYMILQGYDFLELNRRYGCALQFGGSDQWGNIVQGVELSRRVDGREVFGLTTPLITTADGAKMGKTANGAIWLNEAQLPAYDYWQFWRNTADADVGRFLRLFTTLPLDEIAKLEALEGAEINDAKKILATEATAFVRGRAAAEAAAATAKATFEAGTAGEDLPRIDWRDGLALADALVQLGFASSKNEARRLVQQGGIKINGAPAHDGAALLAASDLQNGQIKLSAGKKRHGLVVAG